MSAPGSSSTAPEDRQLQMERRAQEAAANRAAIDRAKLRQRERESVTEYGRAIFNQYAEPIALALEHTLGEAINGDLVAGPYHAGMWPLFQMGEKGPRSIASIALAVVLDKVSQRCSHRSMAVAIGRAIETEIRALPIEDRGQDLLRIGRRRHGKELASLKNLKALQLPATAWTRQDQFQCGAFLLEIIIAESRLLRSFKTVACRGLQIEPTELLQEFIKAHPPRPRTPVKLPMLVPPRPWHGMEGGGHLTNRLPLVRSRKGHPLDYLTTEALEPALTVVNRLQEQQLELDPWIIGHQRIAWDASIRGLFPISSRPPELPPMPHHLVGREAIARRQAELDRCHQDRRNGAYQRNTIERSLRQAEELAGQPLWFGYCMDMRGRLYTANRATTHQGPDWEKAQVLVANARPCDDRAADWIFKAAAIHWGVKGTWVDRLQWGRSQLERMLAAAEDPVERAHLWRDAKEPWQFLACCRAMQLWLDDPSQPIRHLVRLDQTTSGPGIIGALIRDQGIARACNMVGSSRHDLYEQVAEEVTQLLRSDSEAGSYREQRLARGWLELGISRAMAKLPVMSTVYGAQWLGVTEQLVALLDEAEGVVALDKLMRQRLEPCRYLARKFGLAVGARLNGAVALQKWLRETCRRCMKVNKPMVWTTPMGLPIRLGKELSGKSTVRSLLHGSRRWATVMDDPVPGELSGRETGRGITANLIHSFDAALVWAMVNEAAEQGITVLPNHDCFAVPPCDADWLAATLSQRIIELYRPDWLTEIAAEIAAAARGVKVPTPPMVGTLDVEEIGRNPYLFS